MNKIQNAFHLNAKHYSELSFNEKSRIDSAAKILAPLESTILLYEGKSLNIITKNIKYSLEIQSEFPEDITGKMIMAWIEAGNNEE